MESDPEAPQRAGRERGEEYTQGQAEGGADEGGDDALVADHASRLAAGHPDRAEHPELAGAFEHRQHQGVDHAEHADDHRQREQNVEQVKDLGKAMALSRHPRRSRLNLRVRG